MEIKSSEVEALPETARFVEVALVEVALTEVKLRMVEVALFTRMPPVRVESPEAEIAAKVEAPETVSVPPIVALFETASPVPAP